MKRGTITICEICHRTNAFGPIEHDMEWHLSVDRYKRGLDLVQVDGGYWERKDNK